MLVLIMSTCSICLLLIEEDKYITPCEHMFHQNCLSMWSNMAQTCPMCREHIGHIACSNIDMMDELTRVQIAYKLFNMTEDNPELQVIMRKIASKLVRVPFTVHPMETQIFTGYPTYNNTKAFLQIKGFRFLYKEYPYGNMFICKVDTEETEQQYRKMINIMPGYNSSPKHINAPETLVLKIDRTTSYYVDGDSRSRPLTSGVLNAIVRPKCVQYNGRNILQFWAVIVMCTTPISKVNL
jgi:hypothetical protein